MSSYIRRLPMLFGSIAVVALLASCMENGSAPAIVAPSGPAMGYAPVIGCDNLSPATMCEGTAAPKEVRVETLRVCKVYAEGTGPDVEIKLTADYVQFQLGPQTSTYTLHAGECRTLWRNGEFYNGVSSTDVITVSETPVPGYTATSQVTTVIRQEPFPGGISHFDTLTGPVTSATTITSNIGGARVPGALIVFTNTKTPVNEQPSCTLTQGYWKNHENLWPAPYAPGAQWLDAAHQVNGVTWDGLMGMSVSGGNSYMQLAHQWIAATLNLAGATSTNPSVAAAMSQGQAWLESHTPANTSTVPSIKNAQATAWATTLDDFNNGRLGIPHCD